MQPRRVATSASPLVAPTPCARQPQQPLQLNAASKYDFVKASETRFEKDFCFFYVSTLLIAFFFYFFFLDLDFDPSSLSFRAPPESPRPRRTAYALYFIALFSMQKLQVRVWLRGGQHYYVLSRFLVARTLSAAAVPPAKARKAALALKKRLVDAGVLDVGQEDMEAELFAVLEELG